MTSDHRPAGAAAFDFLYGSWRVDNEFLKSRLTGSTEWERFEARHQCWPILGGIGNVDTFSAHWGGRDFEGSSLRIFNPETGLWSIYWSDNVLCALFPPVIGRIDAGGGEFLGEDQHAGQPVKVRFTWSDITPTSILWQQAFSSDDGVTWETNWIMRFTRA
jgi:hypothetical protein